MLTMIIDLLDEYEMLSYWEIYKILKERYNINCDKSNIRYHMEKLRRMGFLGKKDSKYYLRDTTLCINGTVLFTNPPGIINCPYYNSCKNCSFGSKKCCKFFNSLPLEFQKIYLELLNEKNRK